MFRLPAAKDEGYGKADSDSGSQHSFSNTYRALAAFEKGRLTVHKGQGPAVLRHLLD